MWNLFIEENIFIYKHITDIQKSLTEVARLDSFCKTFMFDLRLHLHIIFLQ